MVRGGEHLLVRRGGEHVEEVPRRRPEVLERVDRPLPELLVRAGRCAVTVRHEPREVRQPGAGHLLRRRPPQHRPCALLAHRWSSPPGSGEGTAQHGARPAVGAGLVGAGLHAGSAGRALPCRDAARHPGRRAQDGRVDDEQRWRAVQGRDPRFDGWFVLGVTSTGIYCRPSCPARTPRRRTCASTPAPPPLRPPASARASAAGRTPRPARRPGTAAPTSSPARCGCSPTGSSTARACPGWRPGWATAGGRSSGCCVAELGAGPLALARAQRAQTARTLVETTALPIGRRRVRRRVRQRAAVQRHRARGLRAARRGSCGRAGGAVEPTRGRAGAAAAVPARRCTPDQLFGHLAATAVPGRGGVARRRVPPHAAAAARRRASSRSRPRADAVGVPAAAAPTCATSARRSPAAAGCSTSTPTRWPSTRVLAEDEVLAPWVAKVPGPAGAAARSTRPSSRCAPCSASR